MSDAQALVDVQGRFFLRARRMWTGQRTLGSAPLYERVEETSDFGLTLPPPPDEATEPAEKKRKTEEPSDDSTADDELVLRRREYLRKVFRSVPFM
jgi:hypothetical protein